MKKLLFILLVCIPIFLFAQESTQENKAETKVVKLYGFLKGDAVYASNGVYLMGKCK